MTSQSRYKRKSRTQRPPTPTPRPSLRQARGQALILACLVAISTLAFAPSASAVTPSGIQIEVPLFSNPVTDWSTVVLASPAIGFIVFNPSSGPGGAPNLAYQSLIAAVRAEGIHVLGYVPTAWARGNVSNAQAEAWVKEYYSWYGVDGIMFDEVNDTCASGPVGYYTALYNFVKQQAGSDIVVLNPGTATGECYAAISDVLITFEDTYTNYLQYDAPAWVRTFPGSHFCNVIFDTPAADMKNAVNLAVSRNADRVYVTDTGANGTDPYSSLPSYFGLEVAYVGSSLTGTKTLELVTGPAVGRTVPAVTAVFRNDVPSNLKGQVYLVVHNAEGQTVFLSTAVVTPTAGGDVVATLPIAGVPHGNYDASLFAADSSGVAISQSVPFSFTP